MSKEPTEVEKGFAELMIEKGYRHESDVIEGWEVEVCTDDIYDFDDCPACLRGKETGRCENAISICGKLATRPATLKDIIEGKARKV